MKASIHAARIKQGRKTLKLVSTGHDDLIARVGDYCRRHWPAASAGPPPATPGALIDAYFANSGESIKVSQEHCDLPEPYSSAPGLLAGLESLLAALSAYKTGDAGAFAELCREFNDARALVAKASAALVRAEPVFTVFCQEAGGNGTIHIQALQAPDLESAIIAGKQQCIDDWSSGYTDGESPWNTETVHCLGVIAGQAEVLHWQDLDCW